MSYKHNLIIFGTNELAELAKFYIENDSEYKNLFNFKGFTVNEEFNPTGIKGNSLIYNWEDLESFYSNDKCFLLAPLADNKLREEIYLEGKKRGYKFISYISSKCTNFSNNIGENCFILEDNTIQPFTKIGNNVILWSGNHIGHHSIIEDNVFFTSHVVMSGHCHIKEGSFVGVNACIRDGVTIGKNCVIGMGSVVTKNTDNNSTYIGSPAKKKE